MARCLGERFPALGDARWRGWNASWNEAAHRQAARARAVVRKIEFPGPTAFQCSTADESIRPRLSEQLRQGGVDDREEQIQRQQYATAQSIASDFQKLPERSCQSQRCQDVNDDCGRISGSKHAFDRASSRPRGEVRRASPIESSTTSEAPSAIQSCGSRVRDGKRGSCSCSDRPSSIRDCWAQRCRRARAARHGMITYAIRTIFLFFSFPALKRRFRDDLHPRFAASLSLPRFE